MIFKQILLEADPRPFKQKHSVVRQDKINTYDNLPADVKALAAAGKWAEAYSKLTNSNDIDLFLDKFIDEYTPFSSFTDRIKEIRAPLKRELMNMGGEAFIPETNPILAFLPAYFGLSSDHKLTEDQFKFILTLWSDGVIDKKTLKKRNENDHIIFNKNLYNLVNGDFIVKAYDWLTKKNNVKDYLDYYKANDFFGEGKIPASAKESDLRNKVIFKDSTDPAGEINSATDIQARLQQMQDEVFGEDVDDSGEVAHFVPEDYEEDEIKTFFSEGAGKLDRTRVNKLLNYFRDKGWI